MDIDSIIREFDLNIKGVIHVGAHRGGEYGEYSHHGIQNMLFFEPVASNYRRLLKVLPKDENIRSFRLALGNTTGKQKMYIEKVNSGQSCSLLEPGTHLKLYPSIKFRGRETVRVDKLDNIQFDRSKFNMINIDVQGYELEVFKGAAGTLEHIEIIYSEINTEEVYKGCPLVGDLDAYLSSYGFIRVKEDFTFSTAWGDALYLKRK